MAEKDDRAAKAAAVMSTAAAIAAALAWLKKSKVEAAPGGIPQELMNLVIAIADSADDVDTNTLAMIDAIKALAISVQGWVPNAEGITAVRLICPVAGRAYQLPFIAVPDDMELQIKGWPANGNLIYVGESQSAVTNINQIWPLLPNEAIGYRVKNADLIWASAVVAGESAVCTVEQRK